MKYRVALDSGGELTPELEGREEFVYVPLMLMVNGVHIVDDGHISQKEMVERIAQDPDCPKTACPSPVTARWWTACSAPGSGAG